MATPTVIRMWGSLRDGVREPTGEAEGALYIGRAMSMAGWRLSASKWANPFKVGRDGTLEEVLTKYRAHVLARPELVAALPELAGRRLACWCRAPPGSNKKSHTCHGDVLVELFTAQ